MYQDAFHVTEKTLRPIACAHPFVLAAGPGALEYLRSYGFKTYSDFWDESYDQETDAVARLEKITATMRHIQNLTDSDWQQIQCIADYNQQRFFSNEFADQVTQELMQNLNKALEFCQENRGENYWSWRKIIRRNGFVKKHGDYSKSPMIKTTARELRRHRSLRSHNGPGPVIGQ